jgi:FkbH-like protein
VPAIPEDPAGYVQALARHRYFEATAFTQEDLARARYYAENTRRQELADRSTDIASFLASLAMRMKVEPVNPLNLERVTQLLNKSNQFNLTTRRFTLAEVREMGTSPDWLTLALSLRDNLGDNGLISVLFLRKQRSVLAIHTWVMSCRVLQRGVEQFAFNEVVGLARSAGCSRVLGTYIPTAKNGMVKHHYRQLGFEPAGADGDQTFWSLAVGEATRLLPHYIEREASNG